MPPATRRDFLRTLSASAFGLAASALLPGCAALGAAEQRKRPNFVFILIDDLGWSDAGCYGSPFYRTPNVDRLASQGMRFTDAYAACPVCSPTRASILTGRYPASVNLTDFIPGHWRPWAKLIVPKFNQQLSDTEATLPEMLKKAGYATGGFGKWHLGGGKDSPVRDHGFDVYEQWARNDTDKQSAALTAKAMAFAEKHRERPFFLYLSHHTVHIPIQAHKARIEQCRARLKPGQKFPQQANPAYAAMVGMMDDTVGAVMAKLDELKLADDTVLIFVSDNGGLHKIYTGKGDWVTSNAPLRDEKGTLYEGGIRVPMIVRWPGRVKPGTVSAEPVSTVDFFPTLLGIAGAADVPEVDGVSLLPVLAGSQKLDREALYWHYPHYHHTAPCGAIRARDLKLIEYYEDGRLELYNLTDDLGEKRNLAQTMPGKAAELRAKLDAWRKAVGAKMPTPNPGHDPAKAHLWQSRRKPLKR